MLGHIAYCSKLNLSAMEILSENDDDNIKFQWERIGSNDLENLKKLDENVQNKRWQAFFDLYKPIVQNTWRAKCFRILIS